MLKNIKLKTLFTIIVAIEFILMVLIIYFLGMNIKLNKELGTAEFQRFEMDQTADKLRHSSDDLTRFARAYVVTGNKKYKSNYYKILDIRNGKIPRPVNYQNIYWDYMEPKRSQLHPPEKTVSLKKIMDKLPYSKEEYDKLYESHRNSDGLVNLEIEAFNAMSGHFKDRQGNYTKRGTPDQQKAISLLYSKEYLIAKQKIMQPIDEFILMMNNRTSTIINKLKQATENNNNAFKMVLAFFVIINIFVFLVLYKRIIQVIFYVTDKLKKHKKRDSSSTLLKIKYNDELGLMIREFNSMQSAINNRTKILKQKNKNIKNQHKMIDKYIIISETDLMGNITYASEAFCKISGYTKAELLGKNHRIVRHKEMPDKLYDELWKTITKNRKWTGQIKNKRKDGSSYWIEVVIEPIQNKSGKKIGYRSIRIDITDKKKIEELSVTDRLTQLYNRLNLDEILENNISLAKRYNKTFSIIILDIDKFKHVNDKYGHITGDKVLQHFSGILKDNIRITDSIGRWGGEEFLILCPESDTSDASALAEKLRNIIEEYNFPIVGKKTASFGVTSYIKGDSEKSIVNRADKALYKAKENGRNQVIVQEID